jgi:exopolysaccharide biosynthesis protein
MGRYGQIAEPSSRIKLWDFVSGFGWLVYDGKPRVTTFHGNGTAKSGGNNPSNPTGAIRAPRTAVGLDKDSNLMLLVVDGCEKW